MSVSEVKVGDVPIMAFSDIQDVLDNIIDVNKQVIAGSAVAINPEKVMAASSSPQLLQALLKSTIRYADGVGVKFVVQKRLKRTISRIPGCELWEALMAKSAESGVPVFILGASSSVHAKTIDKLSSQGVNIVGSHDGYFTDATTMIEDIAASGAKIVTVALGSPKQENFIADCRKAHPDAFYMGVGGTYDVFTGNVKRAPKIWCDLGLEWLYRLLSQPTRWRRQITLLKFCWRYVRGKL